MQEVVLWMQAGERKDSTTKRDWENSDRNWEETGSYFKAKEAKCYFVRSTHVEYSKLNIAVLQVTRTLLFSAAITNLRAHSAVCFPWDKTFHTWAP